MSVDPEFDFISNSGYNFVLNENDKLNVIAEDVFDEQTKFLIFDTETTGILLENEHILSIGWLQFIFQYKYQCIDETKTHHFKYPIGIHVLQHKEVFIKYDNIPVVNNAIHINGITDEHREKYGINIESALREFKDVVDSSTYVGAFNKSFDVGFIRKYDSHFFDHCNDKLFEIQPNAFDSVRNCIQRIIFMYKGYDPDTMKFTHKLTIEAEGASLHTAYSDVVAELVILLHYQFKMDVSKYFTAVTPYYPLISFERKYKNENINTVITKAYKSKDFSIILHLLFDAMYFKRDGISYFNGRLINDAWFRIYLIKLLTVKNYIHIFYDIMKTKRPDFEEWFDNDYNNIYNSTLTNYETIIFNK